jgi:hypothetical protein
MQVSRSYDSNISGHFQARIENDMNRSNCHWIVIAKYSVRARIQSKQLPHQISPAFPALHIYLPRL